MQLVGGRARTEARAPLHGSLHSASCPQGCLLCARRWCWGGRPVGTGSSSFCSNFWVLCFAADAHVLLSQVTPGVPLEFLHNWRPPRAAFHVLYRFLLTPSTVRVQLLRPTRAALLWLVVPDLRGQQADTCFTERELSCPFHEGPQLVPVGKESCFTVWSGSCARVQLCLLEAVC